jgi:hypothetical protein
VLSDGSGFLTEVIDTAQGRTASLAEDSGYLQTVSALPKDKLGLLFVNPTDLVQSALSEADPAALTGFPQVATLKAIRGVGVSLSAEPGGFSFDSTVSYDTARLDPSVRAQLDVPVHENKLIGYVPTDSFLVASQEGYDQALRQGLGFLSGSEGEGIRSLLHLDDAIESLTGDVVFESSPGSGGPTPGGAVLLGVKDPRPMQVTLDAIAGLIGGAWKTTTYHGETVRFFEDPDLGRYDVAPAYATFGDAAVLATSPAEIRKLIDVQEGSPSISSSSAYSSAMARVPSGDGTFYLDVSGLVAVVEGLLPSGERAGFDGEVRPNLDPIESVAASAANSSKRQTGRLFVAIKD